MLDPPYTITRCSWPRPVEQDNDRWTSEPDWDAPLMPTLPQPQWTTIHNNICWTIDWCQLFKGELKYWNSSFPGGAMRGFHVIFQIEINEGGAFIFWDDDGSIIRCSGKIIHADRTAHPVTRNEISVSAGDHLEIAQWQNYGDWLWGAEPIVNSGYTKNRGLSRYSTRGRRKSRRPYQTGHPWPPVFGRTVNPNPSTDLLVPYLDKIQQRLRTPNGPALKTYVHGGSPIRTIIALYSMILNGYRPSDVLVFGDHQWSEYSRKLFAQFLPFARLVPTTDILVRIRAYHGLRLTSMARQHWFVMKTCASLLYPPEEFCFMDDDVFILDSVDDALSAFQNNDLVFAPDQDLSKGFLTTWHGMHMHPELLRTKRFNAGLYWLRNNHDPRWLAAQAVRGRPNQYAPFLWEQGFIAMLFAHRNTVELASQRYLFALFDGLPGGILGYDYKLNPCGFASIHFGGLAEKPSDAVALLLAPYILGR